MGLMDMFAKWLFLGGFHGKSLFYFWLCDCAWLWTFLFILWDRLQILIDSAIVQLLPCWLCDCAIFTMLIVRLWLKVANFEYWLCDCAKICILIVRLCEKMQFDCAIVRLCLIVLIVCDCVVYPEPYFYLTV